MSPAGDVLGPGSPTSVNPALPRKSSRRTAPGSGTPAQHERADVAARPVLGPEPRELLL